MDQSGDLFNPKCLSGWVWTFAEFVHHDILDFSPKDYLDHFPIHVPRDDPVFEGAFFGISCFSSSFC